jgi:hypothetical protein
MSPSFSSSSSIRLLFDYEDDDEEEDWLRLRRFGVLSWLARSCPF